MDTTSMAINSSLLSNQDQWKRLDDAIVESILAHLPVADYLRSRFVSRRWESVICSRSFPKAAKELFKRLPWFIMMSTQFLTNVVYDMEVDGWRRIGLLTCGEAGIGAVPLAYSGSLICLISGIGKLLVCNPINGSVRDLHIFPSTVFFKAVAMHAEESYYTVYVVSWTPHGLYMNKFSPANSDRRIIPLKLFILDNAEAKELRIVEVDAEQVLTPVYGINIDFLPTTEIVGVATRATNGSTLVWYLEPSGRLVSCDPCLGIAMVFPPIILGSEFSIALAACHERILVFILMEEDENMMLRVWTFDVNVNQWSNIATMPPEMSAGYNGVNPEISCTGNGDYVMVCVSSIDYNFTRAVVFNAVESTWKELPTCMNSQCGQPRRFLSALPIMPNIEENA